MNSIENISSKVKEILVQELNLSIDPVDIKDEDYLLAGGYNFDSIMIIEVVILFEEMFGVVFEDSELTTDTFTSVSTIAQLIQSKL